jgi:hypothetical protein
VKCFQKVEILPLKNEIALRFAYELDTPGASGENRVLEVEREEIAQRRRRVGA